VARRGLIVLLALLVAAPGCGGDDEPEAAPPLPDLTVPRTDPPPADTVAEPDTTTEPPVTEATPPQTEPETVPDSPTNDTPPPTDSPAERFEDFCNENPGTRGCG
jgi:hypothetical protein